MYKDKAKQKEANREAARRYRHTQGKSVIPESPVIPKKTSHPSVIPEEVSIGGGIPKGIKVPKSKTTISMQTFGFATKGVPGPAWLEDGN